MTNGAYGRNENIALNVIPMITGSISLASSGTIAVMILKCEKRLTYPFRRLIFGLSIADVLQSLAMVTGPFALPASQDPLHKSHGSTFTCELQGFALHIGFAGVPMYVLSLSIYYLCAVKYNINDKVFSRKIEPWLHAISILWTLAGGIACWSSGVFNIMRSGNICWYTPFPYDCVTNDEVECIRGQNAFTFGWIFGGSNAITLAGIITCLVGVCRTVINQEKRMDAYRFSVRVSMESERSERGFKRRLSSMLPSALRFSSNSTDENPAAGAPASLAPSLRNSSYVQRVSRKSKKKKRDTMTQASLYIVAFLVSCIWAYLYGFLVTLGVDVPFAINVLFCIFYPLGGLFNILVYTRPKLTSVRRRYPDLSWIRCFVEVIKAGVEVPEIIISSERGSRDGSDSARFPNSRNSGDEDTMPKSKPRSFSLLIAQAMPKSKRPARRSTSDAAELERAAVPINLELNESDSAGPVPSQDRSVALSTKFALDEQSDLLLKEVPESKDLEEPSIQECAASLHTGEGDLEDFLPGDEIINTMSEEKRGRSTSVTFQDVDRNKE